MNKQARHDAGGRQEATTRAAPEAGAEDEHRVRAGSQGQQERGGQEEGLELRIEDHERAPAIRLRAAQEGVVCFARERYCSGTASRRSVQ